MGFPAYLAMAGEVFGEHRGAMLSPEDCELLHRWYQAGVPLRAVLQGIDAARDEWRAQRRWPRFINRLSFCERHVLRATERSVRARTGA